jgi:catechol 2,3-dioxygenase-like lactoylglutathione lyase family enzyme
MELGKCIPILRIFDIEKAREFYLGFLGFKVEFEHRFNPDAPLYMGVSRDGCALNLSEHHGDGSPGASVRIAVSGIDAYHAELTGKNYRYYHPGIESMPWGARQMSVTDPFGNRIHFFEPV